MASAKMCGACPIPAGSGKTNGSAPALPRPATDKPTPRSTEPSSSGCVGTSQRSNTSSAAPPKACPSVSYPLPQALPRPADLPAAATAAAPQRRPRSGVSELWRDDHGTTPVSRRCPTCATTFTSTGRQRYCQASSRKKAHRLRHTPAEPEITVPAARPQRPHTVYQCPDCDGLQLGEQRCRDCGVFGRSLGLGGNCPHCNEPVTLQDLDLTQQR